MLAVRAGCALLEPLAVSWPRRRGRPSFDSSPTACIIAPPSWSWSHTTTSSRSWTFRLAEKCTLSDPGRLGRQTRCPRFCGGRESYGPGRGRSGYFNRSGG